MAETAKTRSASDALKASDEKAIAEKAAADDAAAKALAAEVEANLNPDPVATEPEVADSEDTIVVKGGTTVAVVTADAFSVLDADGIHNSFRKGDRIKITKAAFDRGVALGALKK